MYCQTECRCTSLRGVSERHTGRHTDWLVPWQAEPALSEGSGVRLHLVLKRLRILIEPVGCDGPAVSGRGVRREAGAAIARRTARVLAQFSLGVPRVSDRDQR